MHNRFIFRAPDKDVSQLSKRAVNFVMSYRQMKEQTSDIRPVLPKLWKPPIMGILNMNFDCGKAGEHRWGRSSIARGYDGAIVLAGVQQGQGITKPMIGEAQACLFALQTAQEYGLLRLCFEGDCLPLV